MDNELLQYGPQGSLDLIWNNTKIFSPSCFIACSNGVKMWIKLSEPEAKQDSVCSARISWLHCCYIHKGETACQHVVIEHVTILRGFSAHHQKSERIFFIQFLNYQYSILNLCPQGQVFQYSEGRIKHLSEWCMLHRERAALEKSMCLGQLQLTYVFSSLRHYFYMKKVPGTIWFFSVCVFGKIILPVRGEPIPLK